MQKITLISVIYRDNTAVLSPWWVRMTWTWALLAGRRFRFFKVNMHTCVDFNLSSQIVSKHLSGVESFAKIASWFLESRERRLCFDRMTAAEGAWPAAGGVAFCFFKHRLKWGLFKNINVKRETFWRYKFNSKFCVKCFDTALKPIVVYYW